MHRNEVPQPRPRKPSGYKVGLHVANAGTAPIVQPHLALRTAAREHLSAREPDFVAQSKDEGLWNRRRLHLVQIDSWPRSIAAGASVDLEVTLEDVGSVMPVATNLGVTFWDSLGRQWTRSLNGALAEGHNLSR